MRKESKLFNDEIDFISLISVLFEKLNFLFAVFITSFFVILIFYLSSTNLYRSDTLIEIKNDKPLLPGNLSPRLNIDNISGAGLLEAEIEIYKSNDTVYDALKTLHESDFYKNQGLDLNASDIKGNLSIKSNSKSLITISFVSDDKELSSHFLGLLNEEFIRDRRNFIKQSSTAGKEFISQEIPRIKVLLKEAEENLNKFKVSTNTSDVIFDSTNRNTKLERLKNRIDEISFKELELREFYKENHPIYLTLSEQKKLILSQIKNIEDDLPNIPSTQRTLENLKREVSIYANVLKELSSQEISLSMSEASSLSNVRIINEPTAGVKVSPRTIVFVFCLVLTFLVYLIFLLRHFIGDRISNLDALIDYVGKNKVIGELPFLDNKKEKENDLSLSLADELLNKTVYEMLHSELSYKAVCIVGSRKDVGKTEISKRIFNKLKSNHKVCLLDLDYRKKGLTKELYKKETSFRSFEEFNQHKADFLSDNESIFIPSLEVENPPDFFVSKEFKDQITNLKNEYDFIICDTPPWKLFVDAKIISEHFDNLIYVVCNQLTLFKDIDLFLKDIKDNKPVTFFYNKFRLYFNFFWYKYQYPYYSNNYYYDYNEYSNFKTKKAYSRLIKYFSSNYRLIISKLKEIFNQN